MSRIITNNIRHNDATVDSITLDSAGNVNVPNDLAVDTDTLFVDASADRVGIGTTNPSFKTEIVNTLQADANLNYSLAIRGDDTGTTGESSQIFLGAINGTTRGCAIASILTANANAHDMAFKVSGPSATPTERMRILSSGGLTFNGDTAAANALDDYEEGTWTPEYANVNNPTYSAQDGRYVKIGTLCHISGRIALSNKGTANANGGNPVISLPFDKATGSDGFRYVAGFQWENLSTSVSNVYGLMYLTSYISIYKQSANNTSSTFLTHADLANNTVLHFSVAYRTA